MSYISKSHKRKNKKKYFQSAKKPKFGVLGCGMKGFLITCNNEFRCIMEAYNLLNEFADELFGPEFKETLKESADLDVDEQLAKEIAEISSKQRRFQQVSTKVKGVIFINTTVPDPVLLVDKIFKTILETRSKKTRFILKLKPVSVTCKAYENDIKNSLEQVLMKYSAEESKELKFKVECKISHNDSITSSHLTWYVRDCMKDAAPKWIECILSPEIIISFYVLRTVCCISVLRNYEEFRKYNLSEILEATKNTVSVVSNEEQTLRHEDVCEKEMISENQAQISSKL